VREDYDDPVWLATQMHVDKHGIHRWRDSGQIPSKEILKHLSLSAEDMLRHNAARDADLDAFAAEYQRRQAQRTPEEIAVQRAEARAAHGPRVELVNIFTGEHYIT
jgi:hypothetical protein